MSEALGGSRALPAARLAVAGLSDRRLQLFARARSRGRRAARVHDRATLASWIAAIVAQGSGRIDADILRDAHRAASAGDLERADRRQSARRRLSRDRRNGARDHRAGRGLSRYLPRRLARSVSRSLGRDCSSEDDEAVVLSPQPSARLTARAGIPLRLAR